MRENMRQALYVNKASAEAIEFIKREEGLRLNAYQDSVGIWTIGYGHTGNILHRDAITLEQAERLLHDDILTCERLLNDAIVVPVTQNQFDALVSLIFNIGPGRQGKKSGLIMLKNGQPSTLLRRLNKGDFQGAAEQFSCWIYAAGKPLQGLINRRSREKLLFQR